MARRHGLGIAVLAALVGATQATAEPAASRIVDRTVVCQMPGIGSPDPIRFMTFSAMSEDPPIMFAGNGPDFETRISVNTGPTGRLSTGSVAVNRRDCTSTKLHVPLAAAGLRGGRSTPSRQSFSCDVPVQVLMRVRAVFRRPTTFSRDRETPWLRRARGRIATAQLAIATLRRRKPIAFASVDGTTGKARIFVAPTRCTSS